MSFVRHCCHLLCFWPSRRRKTRGLSFFCVSKIFERSELHFCPVMHSDSVSDWFFAQSYMTKRKGPVARKLKPGWARSAMAENGFGSLQPKPLLYMKPVITGLGSSNLKRSRKRMAKVWKSHESHSMMVVRIQWLFTPTLVLLFWFCHLCWLLQSKGFVLSKHGWFLGFRRVYPPAMMGESIWVKTPRQMFPGSVFNSRLSIPLFVLEHVGRTWGKKKTWVHSTYIT